MAKGFIRERITKKGDHRWDVVVNYKDSATGEWKRLWKTVDGSRKADTLKTKMLGEVDKGYIKPSKISVEVHLNEWLKGSVRSTVSPRTYQLYEYIARKHLTPALGNIPLSRLRPQNIQMLYADKLQEGLSPRTVQLLHVTLHKALDNAVKTGLITHNPIDAVDQPKVERHQMKTMSEDDVNRFLNEARKGDYYSLFFMYLFTGLRRNEALALRWNDIDLLGAQLSVNRTMQFIGNKVTFKQPKTASSRRQIALSPSTCVMLRLHRETQDNYRKQFGLVPLLDSELVFCQYDGKPYSPDVVTRNWIKLVRRCGLDGIRLHDARHSHASLLLKQGVHPKVVSERLGHTGIAITMDLYSHVAPGMQKAAAAGFDDAIIGKVSQNNSLDTH
jgi:integrase